MIIDTDKLRKMNLNELKEEEEQAEKYLSGIRSLMKFVEIEVEQKRKKYIKKVQEDEK